MRYKLKFKLPLKDVYIQISPIWRMYLALAIFSGLCPHRTLKSPY